MTKTILAILAHPDDVEFLCAGTLIRLAQAQQWAVHIASMTPGDCGSMELPPLAIAQQRRQEGTAAAAVMGAQFHCVEERDLRVVYGELALERVVYLVNAVRPQILLTHSPDDYHLDHEQTSKLVRAAAFAAPVPNFLYGRHVHPPLEHIPHLYYCDPVEGKDAFGQPIYPGFHIDVTSVIDTKEKMLACHQSQRDWLMRHHGVDNYLTSMRDWAATQGQAAGVAYAEGFRQHLGHGFPQTNLLAELLGAVGPAA